MDGKVFSPETKKFLGDTIDEVVKLPWYLETFDGVAFNWVINWLDTQGDKFIPDEYDGKLDHIAILCAEKKFEAAAEVCAELVNQLVDIPYMEEDMEGEVFKQLFTTVVMMVKMWLNKKKGA